MSWCVSGAAGAGVVVLGRAWRGEEINGAIKHVVADGKAMQAVLNPEGHCGLDHAVWDDWSRCGVGGAVRFRK